MDLAPRSEDYDECTREPNEVVSVGMDLLFALHARERPAGRADRLVYFTLISSYVHHIPAKAEVIVDPRFPVLDPSQFLMISTIYAL